MTCPICEKEIEEGSLYCNHCGSAVQIVPDFNLLEDEVLPSMLDSTRKEKIPTDEKKEIERHINKKWIILISVVSLVLIIGIAIGFTYTHSFSYYCKKADLAYTNGNLTDAISLYHKALDETEDAEVYLSLGKVQKEAEYYDEAESSFLKSFELNPKGEEAILQLVLLYDSTNDYEAMDELLSMDLTEAQIAIVNEYGIPAPKFSVSGGEYEDDVELTLYTSTDFSIYYTLDGTEPTEHNGTLFEKPIEISKQGTTIVTAVCINSDGKHGIVASETYEITYVTPETPVIYPTGGRISKETYVTITAGDDSDSVYYTWDGSMPTKNSAKYTDPILVPEGNNILTVISINEHGMVSEVVRENYIYLP